MTASLVLLFVVASQFAVGACLGYHLATRSYLVRYRRIADDYSQRLNRSTAAMRLASEALSATKNGDVTKLQAAIDGLTLLGIEGQEWPLASSEPS